MILKDPYVGQNHDFALKMFKLSENVLIILLTSSGIQMKVNLTINFISFHVSIGHQDSLMSIFEDVKIVSAYFHCYNGWRFTVTHLN